MRALAFIAALAALVVPGLDPGIAQTRLPFSSGAAPAPSYNGPGDVAASAVAFWGLNAYNAAEVATGTQAMVNVKRSTDNVACDILVGSDGHLGNTSGACAAGVLSASSFCTAGGGTCNDVRTLYDQSGNSHDCTARASPSGIALSNSGQGIGTAWVMTGFGFGNSLDCTIATTAQPFTLTAVVDRTPTSGSLTVLFSNNSNAVNFNWYSNDAAALLVGTGGTGVTMTDTFWHSMIGIFNNGSASTLAVDGTGSGNAGTLATTGLTNGVNATWIGESGLTNEYFVGYLEEIGLWPSSLTVSTMCQNQQARLGAGNFAGAC